MAKTKSQQSEMLKVPACTLSYPHVFQRNDDGKYSTQMILDPKKDKAFLKKLESEMQAVFEKAGFDDDDYESRINEPNAKQLKKNPILKGKVFLNCSNSQKPHVFDEDGSAEIVDEQETIYGGVIATGVINVYSYSHPKQGDGIALSLNAVRRVSAGERLGGAGMGLEDAQAMLSGDSGDYEDDEKPVKEGKKEKKEKKGKKNKKAKK